MEEGEYYTLEVQNPVTKDWYPGSTAKYRDISVAAGACITKSINDEHNRVWRIIKVEVKIRSVREYQKGKSL